MHVTTHGYTEIKWQIVKIKVHVKEHTKHTVLEPYNGSDHIKNRETEENQYKFEKNCLKSRRVMIKELLSGQKYESWLEQVSKISGTYIGN